MVLDTASTTPRTIDLLNVVFDGFIRELHFAIPGKVIEYDLKTNQVSVLPQVKRKYIGAATAHDLPIINNVPVIFPRTENSHIKFPIKPGDFGQILFNERSIDIWQSAGTETDPQDARKFDLNDAVFIPGLFPLTKPLETKGAPDSVEIRNNSGFIEILSNGKFRIKNENAELFTELVGIMEQLITGFNELGTTHRQTQFLALKNLLIFPNIQRLKAHWMV